MNIKLSKKTTKFISIAFFCTITTLGSPVAYAGASELAKQRQLVSESINGVVGKIFTAIWVAYSEGLKLGKLPADPARLALLQPAGYENDYIRIAAYDRFGRVVVLMKDDEDIGDARGTILVYQARVSGNDLVWEICASSTMPASLHPGYGLKGYKTNSAC